MSSYTSSYKKKLSTAIDDFGQLIDVPRLDDESLFNYRERLLDTVKNQSDSSRVGTNLSLARQVGLIRSHILTIDCITTLAEEPFIEITSKYFTISIGGTTVINMDLYTSTLEDLYIQIGLSVDFDVSYINDDFNSIKLTKLFYDNNLKSNINKNLLPSKVNNLGITYIKDILFTSDNFKYKKSSLEEVVDVYDYYIDYENGIVFSGTEAMGSCSLIYYEIPYKLFYTPVSYYPLNDKDIDYIIKDSVLTDEGTENKILNSKGAKFIQELISTHPLNWGI